MLIIPCFYSSFSQIVTLRLSYKLVWPEARLVVNESADWGEEGEINISPDNIVVIIYCFCQHFDIVCVVVVSVSIGVVLVADIVVVIVCPSII